MFYTEHIPRVKYQSGIFLALWHVEDWYVEVGLALLHLKQCFCHKEVLRLHILYQIPASVVKLSPCFSCTNFFQLLLSMILLLEQLICQLKISYQCNYMLMINFTLENHLLNRAGWNCWSVCFCILSVCLGILKQMFPLHMLIMYSHQIW